MNKPSIVATVHTSKNRSTTVPEISAAISAAGIEDMAEIAGEGSQPSTRLSNETGTRKMTDSIFVEFVFATEDLEGAYVDLIDSLSGLDNYRSSRRDDRHEYYGRVIRDAEPASFSCALIGYEANADWYTLPSEPAIEMEIGTGSFSIGDKTENRVDLLIEMIESISGVLDEYIYAFGLDTEHVGSIGKGWGPDKPVTDESLGENRINEVSWLMLFGSELVAEYGREWLLRAPAWKRQELDDGAILLVASPDPTDYEQFSEDRDILRTYFDRRGNDSE